MSFVLPAMVAEFSIRRLLVWYSFKKFPIIFPAAGGEAGIRFTTPAKASEPYITLAGPFTTSTLSTVFSSTSMPCSSPHCCPSSRTPSYKVRMRLKPRPRIKGFETLGPVVTSLIPGTVAIASIIFVFRFCCRNFLFIETIGTGFRMIELALEEPVTTIASSSTTEICMVKFSTTSFLKSIFFTTDL